ncbi:MAG TPA: kelch repeat-containing protein [Chitinophagales bacterium]|nr:kelch repeat-containing protein [Chitinophagales bacterium]
MKKLFLLFFLSSIFYLLSSHHANAQAGEWTWTKGVATPFGSSGTWGTQGIPDAANEPPALYEACEWIDHDDNLWIFGGANNSVFIYYGTLWKYSIASNTWTWMSGPSATDQAGVYGTQGVPSPSNYPGARGWGELSWTDSSGNFWLMGGYGYDANGTIGCLGDLWEYDVSTNEWTWMKGSPTANYIGSYGTLGVANISNNPPGRQEVSCSWKDSYNNLWMFGGWTSLGNANDLWKYDIASNNWTWMSGSTTANHYGTYGTMGVSSPSNVPGSRAAYSRWIDKQDNLWLYGGNGYSASGNGYLSDLWKFDVTTNEWTWMEGSTSPFQSGVYSSQCDFSLAHYPGDKMEGRSCWIDDCGYFFLYGGTGYNGHQGDLWVYDYVLHEWEWISGDTINNTSAVSGTQGVSSPLNKPGLRTGADSWIDQAGNLWLFGGYVCSNDLWRYVPDYSCIGTALCQQAPQINFSVSDSQLCEKFCISFFDSSINNPTAWQWFFPGGDPSSSTLQNPANICYNTPGVYDVTLITTGASGNDTLTLPNYITVYSTPPIPTITQVGYTLTSSSASSYQWQFNTIDIPGATNQSYTILQTGYYTVVVGDSNSCKNSFTVYVLITGIHDVMSDANISIYPNPATDGLMVEWLNGYAGNEISISILNALGQEIYSSELSRSTGTLANWKKEIDLHDAASGVYFIEIKSQNIFLKKKIIITK